MDIRQLHYFIETCKIGSITKAADALFISQQGLSSSIRRLENELNCVLFYRKGNDLHLTEQGKYLLDHGREIVDSFDKLQNHFHNINIGLEDQLMLMCVHGVLSKCPEKLQKLLFQNIDSQGNPLEIKLSFGECYSSECPDYFKNNYCNFAICYEQDWVSDYEAYFLFPVEHCFVVHKDHPYAKFDEISFQQLDNQNLILPQRKTAMRHIIDNLIRTYHLHPHILYETYSAIEISNLIMNNHSIIARMLYGDAIALNNNHLKILKIKDIDLVTHAVLVHRRDMPMSETEKLFQKLVLDAVK